MKEIIKIFIIYLSRFVLSFFHLFPIKKNQILFIAHSGSNFTCNPKYIYKELLKQKCNYKYIWVLNKNENIENAAIVKYKSLKFYYYFCTSKLIICNYSISAKLPVRKNQILFNTWHGGGGYKKVGVTKIRKEKKRTKKVFDILSKETSYFLSSCKVDTPTLIEAFNLEEKKIQSIGYPRNDIFFDNETNIEQERKRICNLLSIPSDKKILLVAPTFRGEPGYGIAKDTFTLDIKKICSILNEKFAGDFVCIYRGHYYINSEIPEDCINGSDYPDMQELLLISDVLITDYSSCMWDYSFTYKPCFLYTPDLEEYSTTVEFYVPIDKWGFDYAITEEELVTKIQNFDLNKYKKDMIQMHDYFGAFDKGDSAKKAVDLIRNIMN